MDLWSYCISVFSDLRPAFKNYRTYFWSMLIVMGFCCGIGAQGAATDFIRILGLDPKFYPSILRVFRSKAIDLDMLRLLWVKITVKLVTPFKISGHTLLAIDEIKRPKEGRKMPGSRTHHQSSTNNSKAEYIMGHNVMMIGLIVQNSLNQIGLIPLISKILGGIRLSPKDKKTCFDHSVQQILSLSNSISGPLVIVADALYCVAPFASKLFDKGIHVISRIKGNGVAYYPFDVTKYTGRGRIPLYGSAVNLKSLFIDMVGFTEVLSPIPGEEKVTIKYLRLYLIPKWFGRLASYTLVSHPKRGNIVLFTTNRAFSWDEVYLSYYYRFQIECSFKTLVYNIGAFCYRFWCRPMEKTKIGDKDRYVHKEKKEIRDAMMETLRAYEIFMAFALISYGILQALAISKSSVVWSSFNGWIRTIRPNLAPSINVTSKALQDNLFAFLYSNSVPLDLAKFYESKAGGNGQIYQKTG